jgi:DNA-directed RNA polymerase specialized sigma24 family protein
MSSNENHPNLTKTLANPAVPPPPLNEIVAKLTISPEAEAPTAGNDTTAPPVNDNATRAGVLDTTALVASGYVVRYVRGALQRHGVAWQDMGDAIAEVQADAIEAARAGRMPANAAEWRALGALIAVRWAVDRRREAKVRDRYDAGLCGDADAYMRPTLYWEQRDPVDTKRYLAILKELFDSGQMPEDGAEILWGEADGVPHAELAAELGVSETVVKNRLFRMRAKFRTKLASLGLLILLLLLTVALLASLVGGTGRAPQTQPVGPAPAVSYAP